MPDQKRFADLSPLIFSLQPAQQTSIMCVIQIIHNGIVEWKLSDSCNLPLCWQ